MFGLLRALFLVFPYVCLSYGVLLTNPAQVGNKTYDYVVVGGGTAGSVIAGRLAENANSKILVIEAGISNEGVTNSIVPFFAFNASPNTYITWNYTTTPQVSMFNRVIDYPRGRLLGGSSGINIMIYTRGSSEEYDRIAKVTGDPGWSYSSMLPYIAKHEKWTAPQDGHDTTGQYDPKYHSTNGKVKISLPNYPTAIDDRVIKTLGQVPGFNFVKDMNSGNTLGFGWTQASIGGGERCSAATAYLTGQPNIDILVQTTATRLIQKGTKNGKPYFTGVEFAATSSSPRYTVTASKEIVLSAGAVASPQILLLSGVGPKSELTKLGITTIVDSKHVGKNLQDHAFMGHQFEVSGTETFETIASEVPDLLHDYLATKKGPLSNGLANHIGWTRLPSNDTFLAQGEPAAGKNSPHNEYIFSNGFGSFVGQAAPKPHYLSIFTSVAAPTSRGSITLASKDPFASPNIDPAFLSTAIDLHAMVEVARGVRRFVSGPAWADYIIAPHEDSANVNFDSTPEVETYVKKFTGTQWHPSSTLATSKSSSSDGVVDPKLCVKGVAGVRVVDASVFPSVPAAHLQAVLYAVSERAADLIKAGSC